MNSMKKKAYDKLFKYVNKEYPGDNINWYTDVEDEDGYTMRAELPDGTKRAISISYKTNEIADEKVDNH